MEPWKLRINSARYCQFDVAGRALYSCCRLNKYLLVQFIKYGVLSKSVVTLFI